MIAALAVHPVLLELARRRIEIRPGRDFKRDLPASHRTAMAQLDCKVAELAGEIAPILFLRRDHETDHIGVVIGKPIQIRGLEYGMSYPTRFDHFVSSGSAIIAHPPRPERKTAMRMRWVGAAV